MLAVTRALDAFQLVHAKGFFAVVLAPQNLPLPWCGKKFNLLWASGVFSAAWEPLFALPLMLSTLVDWFAPKGLHVARTSARRAFLETLNFVCRPRFRTVDVSTDTCLERFLEFCRWRW